MNKATGYKNGKTFTMDVPPMIVNDRTMLPVRALASALDLNIQWDDATRTVSIENDGKHHADNTYNTDKSNHTHYTYHTERELCHAEQGDCAGKQNGGADLLRAGKWCGFLL